LDALDCGKFIVGYQKGFVGLHKTYYGMLRVRAKGGEKVG